MKYLDISNEREICDFDSIPSINTVDIYCDIPVHHKYKHMI